MIRILITDTICINFDFRIASIKHQKKKHQFKTAEAVRKSGKKARNFKPSEPLQNRGSRVRILLPLPKPKSKGFGFSLFWCVLFCISLSKAEMTSVFNSFISKNPILLSNISNCSNPSVWYSIKKAAADLLYLCVFSSFKKYFSLFLVFLQTHLTFLSKYRIL